MDILGVGKNTLKIEADALLNCMENMDESFCKAVDIAYECEGRVVVTGMGKSGIIARKIAATLASTGTPSLFLHPAEGVHGDLGMLVRGDIVIALSNSGETSELLSILPVIRRFKIPLISIVGKMNSTLAKRSDVALNASINKEACPLNLAPTASTTVSLAVGDALAVALLEKRGFQEEDFAIFHPSGALGKKLLLRVTDLLHTDAEVPVVKDTALVSEAVLEISEKGFGCTSIVDENGSLKAILTDGDLRRGIEKHTDIFSKNVMEVASLNPKTVDSNALAAKALQIMEEFEITSILTVDADMRPNGLLHLHDILKSGVV